jgi:uncharacterized membrane protein
MQATVVACFAALIVFGGLDFIWLSFAAEAIYRPAIGDLRRPSFDVAPAAAFYVIYIAGLVVLVIRQAATPGQALIYGAVYGFCAYATYDLQPGDAAHVAHEPFPDRLAWGTFATAIAAACGFVASRYF